MQNAQLSMVQQLKEELAEKDKVLEQVAKGDYHTNPVIHYKALARDVLSRYDGKNRTIWY